MSFGQTGTVTNEHDKSPTRSRFLVSLLALFAAVSLVAASCADDSEESGSDDSSAQEESAGQGESADDGTPGALEVPEECVVAGLAAAEDRGQPGFEDAAGVEAGSPKVIEEGDGDSVTEGGSVDLHYVMFNAADGSELDSSWALGGPQQGALDALPDEIKDALDQVKVGGRVVVALPASEVFGPEPPPDSGIDADGEIVMVIDLVDTDEATAPTPEADEAALAAAEERGAPEMSVPEGTAETEELVVIDEVEGEGAVVCPGDTVVAHYTGIQASDGEEFDSSWERGEPSSFSLNQVIQGWSEGLVGMKVGGRRTLVIPADLAYGEEAEAGRPGGVLVFTVDMVGVG